MTARFSSIQRNTRGQQTAPTVRQLQLCEIDCHFELHPRSEAIMRTDRIMECHGPPVAYPFASDQIGTFCVRWRIREFALFGSVLREDFRADSDIDVRVSFELAAPWSLWDLLEMQEQLGDI